MPDYGTVGKYRLLQPLAQGGMAEIFLAKHEGPAGFSKAVVIKRVLPHLSQMCPRLACFPEADCRAQRHGVTAASRHRSSRCRPWSARGGAETRLSRG